MPLQGALQPPISKCFPEKPVLFTPRTRKGTQGQLVPSHWQSQVRTLCLGSAGPGLATSPLHRNSQGSEARMEQVVSLPLGSRP